MVLDLGQAVFLVLHVEQWATQTAALIAGSIRMDIQALPSNEKATRVNWAASLGASRLTHKIGCEAMVGLAWAPAYTAKMQFLHLKAWMSPHVPQPDIRDQNRPGPRAQVDARN